MCFWPLFCLKFVPPPSWSLVRIRITILPLKTFSRNFLNRPVFRNEVESAKEEKFLSKILKKISIEDLRFLEKFLKRRKFVAPRLEISKLNKSRGSSWRDRVVPIDLYEGCRIESKIGTREINLEENCSCREEGRGRKELGSGSRSERSDDTMLSIWTASTLSIACGEPFKFKPSMRRCLSCSSLVDGKLWCKSNLDYTEQLSQQSFNPCRNDFREHPILNLICKRKERNWNVIGTKMIEISSLPIIFNDYLFYQNCMHCIMCYENINNPFGWLIRKKEVLEVLLGVIWRWLRISTLIFTMIVLIWL